MNEYTPSLARLAKLARARREFLASLLAVYQEQKKLDDQQLAEFLGCNVEALTHLALCQRPRPFPDFRHDIERIASHVQANPLQLAKLIRTAESLEDIREVLDGMRAPTREERLDGVLANVHIGIKGHLMERPDEGVPTNFILDAEDRADRLALELLAPAASLRERMQQTNAPTGYRARLAFLTTALYTEYGLPQSINAFYAEMLLHQWGEPTFRDWLFER